MPGHTTWKIEGNDFVLDERGYLVLDETVATSIMCALDQKLGAWWANSDHGSRVAALMRGTPDPNPAAALESAVREALAPLERAGRIRDLDVTVADQQGRASIQVHVLDVARGRPVTVERSP